MHSLVVMVMLTASLVYAEWAGHTEDRELERDADGINVLESIPGSTASK